MRRKRLIKRSLLCAAAALLAGLLTTQPAMASAATMHGIDVSSWQPSDVTERVSGDFAIVKLTQGTGYVNPRAGEQLAAAVRSGKEIGVYHYASGTNCTAEADFFARQARPWLRKAVLALDWEEKQNLDWGSHTWATCFIKRVKSTTGITPMVYVQASALSQVSGARSEGAGLWVAQYASMRATGYQASPWGLGRAGEAMRQYTSSGLLAGYGGFLDLNIFRGDRNQWRMYANPQGAPTPVATPAVRPAPAPQPKPAPAPRTQPCYSRCVTVRRGDSLSSIAARYGGSWRDWTGYRSGNPNRIYVGERVCRGGYTPATARTTATHAVRRGETLSGIASRYGTTWQHLAAKNGLRNPNLIYPGQRLLL